jgi:molybdopterin converting factor small subunit
MPDPAPLRVLVLGPLRDRLGWSTADLPFPDEPTQAAFWSAFRARFPAAMTERVRLARGDEFLLPEERLQPGDELALIPPVSGG